MSFRTWPTGKCRTFVVGLPWSMVKSPRRVRLAQIGFDYPVLSLYDSLA